jgi:small-conductance mechanosensitive channel
MNSIPLSHLWLAPGTDSQVLNLLWQIGTIAVCIALAWGMARVLRIKLSAREPQLHMMRVGIESFTRVLAPLLALALVAIAKPILAQWQQVGLLRVAIPLITSFVLIRLTFYVLRRVFARGGRAGNFLIMFEKLFAVMVWLGLVLYITGSWPSMVLYLESIFIPVGRHNPSLLFILQAVASVGVTLILALWAAAILEERLMRLDTMHSSLRAVMARVGRASLILVAVLVSLSLVGIDLTVLSVFGGALGVGLGLGLQKLVSSYVSGFVILLERSLSIGDMVTVDKYSGIVTRINTRYTILRGIDGIETVVPNEMLVSGPVQNYSLSDRSLRLATHITVSYQNDVGHVLRLLEEGALNVPRISRSPAPEAVLVRFGADGLEMEVGFWIADPENGRLSVISEVNQAIWKLLLTHHVSVPYAQRELKFLDDAVESKKKAQALEPDFQNPANDKNGKITD